MLILGLDPGSRHTGYGVVRREGTQLSALTHGRLSVGAHHSLPDRLAALTREVDALLCQFRPDAAVLESLFHGINSRSLIVLAQARGAILGLLGGRELAICEYSPAEVKRAVTGNGRADKQQVAHMVRLLLGLKSVSRSSDATDALAVAICYAQRFEMERLADRMAQR